MEPIFRNVAINHVNASRHSRKCGIKYFSSKGASLVLIWTFMLTTAFWLLIRMYSALFQGIKDIGTYSHLGLTPVIPFFLTAPLVGWLVDVKYGNFRVFRAGCCLLHVASILGCVSILLLENFNTQSQPGTLQHVVSGGVGLLVYVLGFVGMITCIMTVVELGLQQIPDASATSVSSFITWFLFSIFAGCWLADSLYATLIYCSPHWAVQLFSIVASIFTSLACCTVFLVPRQWLLESKPQRAFATIYQVVKYAAKSKAPTFRSSFLYLEDNVKIPSKIDMGKSKYGGPFTAEQVEEVKTFLKIITILLPLLVVCLAASTLDSLDGTHTFNMTNCTSQLVYNCYSPWWNGAISTVVYELLLYPLIGNRMIPSTLRRIGMVLCLVALGTVAYLIAVFFFYNTTTDISLNTSVPGSSLHIAYSVLYGVALVSIGNALFQFVCAQSPYSMRGILAGCTLFVFFTVVLLGKMIYFLFYFQCQKNTTCHLIYATLFTATNVIGLFGYCIAARHYKWRTREDHSDNQPRVNFREVLN